MIRSSKFLKAAILCTVVSLLAAQDHPIFKVKVDMVVLSFQVTDNKGHYINGLKPKDFRVLEDGIPQKFVTFAEGSKPPVEDHSPKARSNPSPSPKRALPKAAPTPSSAPTFSYYSTPAIICTGASSTPPTPSPISCAAWTARIPSPSTPTAAIFRAPRR